MLRVYPHEAVSISDVVAVEPRQGHRLKITGHSPHDCVSQDVQRSQPRAELETFSARTTLFERR
jgi:hypothetical protein